MYIMESPWNYPSRNLRLSDADRENALSALSEHYQAGRLTADEFDNRSREILQAKTAGQFTDVFADLPQDPAAPLVTFGQGSSAPSARGRDLWPAWLRILLATVIIAAAFSVLRRVSRRFLVALAVAIAIVIILCTHRGSAIGNHPLELAPIALLLLLARKQGRRSERQQPRRGPLGDRFGDQEPRRGPLGDRFRDR